MTTWTYILQSVPWALAGAFVGFFMGRSTAAVQVIADAVQEGESMPEVPRVVAWWRRITVMHVLGLVVVVLGVFTVVQSYVQNRETERLGICQTAYSNGFSDVLEARARASAEAQDALDELIKSVSTATPTLEGRTQVRDALAVYLGKRKEAKQAQEEHPFPQPPRDVCE